MRFAGDPSIGRSSSKVAVGVTFTLDFSRGGSIQMAAGLGETWENALGIPSLALTHFAFVGDLRYGQMTLDTSAAVEFGGVVSADVAGQLVLKPNLPLEYHLEGTQSFQLFGFTLQSAHFVVDDTDGVFVEGTLDLGVAQVSLHGSFWRDAGGVDRFDLGGSQNITLSGFTVQSTSWRVSNDPNPAVNGITMSGSLNIYVAQVSVSGHFWQSNGLRYHLTGSQSIGLGGFTLQSASIVVDNATGVTAAGSVSIPLIGTASMSGSLNASGGTLQYNLTGQTAASFVGFSTTAYLTLSNAGMRMTTTLNNGSWINQTFTGYVASNGAFDISTNGTLNLAGAAGLTFTAGANGTASMTFTGTVAAINAALDGLAFAPTADYNGPAFLSLTVNDLGASGLGGPLMDSDFTSITVTPANDAPVGADATVTTPQDTPYVFTASSFGFTDGDAGDTLAAVRIDALPAAGSLTLSGGAVGAGQVIAVADIAAGNLVFTPALGGTGVPYASFA
ncbi:MAG: hypothetical protein F9K43_20950, partial [Bauldia sp.]